MPTAPDQPLNLGVLCFIGHRDMETRVMDALARAGYDDLSVAQARVVARMGPDGTRMGELAAQAGVTKQTVTSVVGNLERAGYVERLPDPQDHRVRVVRFAERGRSALLVAREAEAEVEARWVGHLGPERAAALREALTHLREIADPWA